MPPWPGRRRGGFFPFAGQSLEEVGSECGVVAPATRGARVAIAVMTREQTIDPVQKPLGLSAHLAPHARGAVAAEIVKENLALKQPFSAFGEGVAQNRLHQLRGVFA